MDRRDACGLNRPGRNVRLVMFVALFSELTPSS
jgi:hypothetical protein